MGIAESVESAITMLLATFVTSRSAALCQALTPVAIAGATIHLTLMGLAIIRGDVNDSLHTFVWKSFRMIFIGSIALSAGSYQALIVDGTDGLIAAILHSMSSVKSVGMLIDQVAEPLVVLGNQIWSKAVVGVMPNVSLLAAAGAVFIAEFLIIAIGLGFYLLAKVAFALVMAIGPIYILCAMWPATEKYTESWIGQALNYGVLKILVGCCILMLTDFASKFAAHISVTADAVNLLSSTMGLLIACGSLMIVMLNLPQLASALSGGASISGIGRTIGRSALDFLHSLGTGSRKPGPGGGSISQKGRSPNEKSTGPKPPNRKPLFQRNTIEHIRKAKK